MSEGEHKILMVTYYIIMSFKIKQRAYQCMPTQTCILICIIMLVLETTTYD